MIVKWRSTTTCHISTTFTTCLQLRAGMIRVKRSHASTRVRVPRTCGMIRDESDFKIKAGQPPCHSVRSKDVSHGAAAARIGLGRAHLVDHIVHRLCDFVGRKVEPSAHMCMFLP